MNADLILEIARQQGRKFNDDEYEGIAALAQVEKAVALAPAELEPGLAYTVALHACIDERRRELRWAPRKVQIEEHVLSTGETMASGCELRYDIARFLESSGPKVREAIARRLNGCPKKNDDRIIRKARQKFGWLVD